MSLEVESIASAPTQPGPRRDGASNMPKIWKWEVGWVSHGPMPLLPSRYPFAGTAKQRLFTGPSSSHSETGCHRTPRAAVPHEQPHGQDTQPEMPTREPTQSPQLRNEPKSHAKPHAPRTRSCSR